MSPLSLCTRKGEIHKFMMRPNRISLSRALQKKTLVDRLFLVSSARIQLLGHFCHLTESKCAFLYAFFSSTSLFLAQCRAVLRRKEINFTALLHKSADDYLTLTLKVLCSAVRLSLGNVRKKFKIFFSSLFPSFPSCRRRYATEQKIFLLNSSSLSADEVIFHCFVCYDALRFFE